MYKINKKVFVSCVSALVGAGLACSIGSFNSCDYFSKHEKDEKIIQNNDAYLYTAVFLNDDVAILISCNSYYNDNGIIHLDDYQFSANNITIFSSNNNASSYDQAINFSLAFADEVYNYEDILNGEYNNIALDFKIKSEMGITKKKDL